MDLSTPTFGGAVHPAYANPRDEVTVLVPAGARRILDVGCSTGEMGAALRARGHVVTGLELDPHLAGAARSRLEHVVEADVEALAASGTTVAGGPFDCVVFADVLEHLRDPWAVVRWGAEQVAPGGSLVVSVPNIRHAKTFWALLVRRRWPYDPVGIFDRTHLRFFTRRNLPELLQSTGFEIAELRRHHLLTVRHTSRWNRLAPLLGDLGTLQLVFRAERPAPAGTP
jgi:2-polyprenyl-3-methyl-5-hydroxy-6-metoxy-1,4-benzoquinol methylase